jgi:hypothetical protein
MPPCAKKKPAAIAKTSRPKRVVQGGYQASDGSTHEYKIGDKASRIKAQAAALAPKKAPP